MNNYPDIPSDWLDIDRAASATSTSRRGGGEENAWAFGKAVRLIGVLNSMRSAPQHRKKTGQLKIAESYYGDVKSSLEKMGASDLQGCKFDLLAAFELAMEGRMDAAKNKFSSVRSRIEGQITTSRDTQTQIQAARVASVSALYENSTNIEQALEEVVRVISLLHNQASIRSMFAICIGSGIINRVLARFTREKKAKPMRQLCIMNFVLIDYFISQSQIDDIDHWPGVAVSSKRTLAPVAFMLRMTDVMHGRLSDEDQKYHLSIHLLASDNAIITYGRQRFGIEAWCPTSLKRMCVFVDGFTQSTSLATCHGTVLYVAKSESLAPGINLTISAFNTLTKKPISVFFMVEGECVHLLCTDADQHSIMVVTDDGVVHRTSSGSFQQMSRVVSFDMESHLSQDNSAVTSTRLFYSHDGMIKMYDITSGSHIMDVDTECWRFPMAVGNYLCTFQMTSSGVILAVEARRNDNMHLIFTYKLNEPSSLESPVIAYDVSDNLMLLLVERVVSLWDLVSGTQLTALIFDVPGILKGYRPCSVCFFRKKYIFVATLGGSLFRFVICD